MQGQSSTKRRVRKFWDEVPHVTTIEESLAWMRTNGMVKQKTYVTSTAHVCAYKCTFSECVYAARICTKKYDDREDFLSLEDDGHHSHLTRESSKRKRLPECVLKIVQEAVFSDLKPRQVVWKIRAQGESLTMLQLRNAMKRAKDKHGCRSRPRKVLSTAQE